MTTFEHVLHGCAPIPLAGYLKALGVFRLVAEQVDAEARGFWRDERFVLRTRLTENKLVAFFVDSYRPTPVVTPWSGGSGFWPKDNIEGIAAIEASNTDRLTPYRVAIRLCREFIDQCGLSEAPKVDAKRELLTALRATLPDDACRWLDGAVALTADGPRYPPIMGTGGNDGRLDFSNNFMRRLVQVIDVPSSRPLEAALFASPTASLDKGAVGQFSPGAAGGVNTGNSFETDSRVNPWDFVLTIEGALVFAAAVARRNAQDRESALAYPFTTRIVGAGSGAAAFSDEADGRAEFWAPLWVRGISLPEMLALMSEGRAVLERGKAALNGLDFARAAAQLGTARGIESFQRHGFLMRAGKAYFATPLGRVWVRENPRASLITELDARGWLEQARKAVRDKTASAALIALGRRLDETLFRLAGDGATEAVQAALSAVGALALEIARRPTMRGNVAPPPRLSQDWAAAADDGSHEFALAEALASLDAVAEGEKQAFRLPFRRHLAALSTQEWADSWDDKSEARTLAVWTGRDLVRDLAAVLERRLIEAQRYHFSDRERNAELPLSGRRAAPLAAVAAFLAGRTDDGRLAELAVGLAWARPRSGTPAAREREEVLPFAYAALKPLFAPHGVENDLAGRRLPDPLPLVRLIRAGRGRDAVMLAQRIARGAGLPAPFARIAASPPADPLRLAAALLVPITGMAHRRLTGRAYPNLKQDQQDSNAA